MYLMGTLKTRVNILGYFIGSFHDAIILNVQVRSQKRPRLARTNLATTGRGSSSAQRRRSFDPGAALSRAETEEVATREVTDRHPEAGAAP